MGWQAWLRASGRRVLGLHLLHHVAVPSQTLFLPLLVRLPSAEACFQAVGSQKVVISTAAKSFYCHVPLVQAQPSGQMFPLLGKF